MKETFFMTVRFIVFEGVCETGDVWVFSLVGLCMCVPVFSGRKEKS